MSKRQGLFFVALCILGASSAPAAAMTPGPGWEANSRAYPTNLPPGGTGGIAINVYNVGGSESGGAVTVTDTLPPGLTATDAGEIPNGGAPEGSGVGHSQWHCAGTTVVTCTSDAVKLPTLAVGDIRRIGIDVAVEAGASGVLTNQVTVAGGGALGSASAENPIIVSATPASFGIASFDSFFSKADGTIDTEAGSHPYEATFSLDFNAFENLPARGDVEAVNVNLPPGLIGNPLAVPQCTRQQLDEEACPPSSQIGVADSGLTLFGPGTPVLSTGAFELRAPLYNMVPPPGIPAHFEFQIENNNVFLDSTVRTGGDNGIVTRARDIPQREVIFNEITLWGIPADPSHDPRRRGVGCEEGCASGVPPKPLLTLPTSCGAPQTFSAEASSWQEPDVVTKASFLSHDALGVPVGYTGCERFSFNPSITVAPDTSQADTPAGLTVEVRPPVGGLEEPEGLGTADIQNTTVTLPEGFVINPGQAAGLQACQPAQDGLTTEAEKAEGKEDAGPQSCPLASKVGTVSIKTPLLEGTAEKELQGNVYVLQSNPPELKLLVAASADGINVKLVGTVHLSEQTGRLTTTFEGTPQLPFTDFKLAFSGGAQAALDTPTACGEYTTTSDFTPWSSPFISDVFPTSAFAITSGPGGGPCPSQPLPFSPSMIAGSTTDQAGGFTNFSLLLQRGDGQQRIEKLQFKAPAGLSGMIAKVPLCTNAQAESNTCPEASKIGHTVVESGPGPYPLVVPQPGQEPAPIYLTAPYNGSGACTVGEAGCAPFGLSIVVPLHVGPFTLPTQRVRAKIELDPLTAALTVTTNPLPQEVAGVPTDLREVDSVIERPQFMINPTNCNPQEFSGTAYGTPPPGVGGPGAQAPISSHFQVGACRSLEFAPKFSVSTSGKTSKSQGASLTAKVSYPSVPQGTQADIAKVKVELPKALPSRLTTLQKACTNKQFEANPAACPPESRIGYATVHTPLLPVPLAGPAIFVSHGDEAFPSLTMVLQGYGVTIDLVGATFIKNGVTSTTFGTVPDSPFSTFELTLPQGKYSALAANGNLCALTTTKTVTKRVTVRVHGAKKTVTRKVKETVASSLVMPNEFVAQNGAVLKQNTKIAVTGCAKKAAKHKAKGKKKGKGKKSGKR